MPSTAADSTNEASPSVAVDSLNPVNLVGNNAPSQIAVHDPGANFLVMTNASMDTSMPRMNVVASLDAFRNEAATRSTDNVTTAGFSPNESNASTGIQAGSKTSSINLNSPTVTARILSTIPSITTDNIAPTAGTFSPASPQASKRFTETAGVNPTAVSVSPESILPPTGGSTSQSASRDGRYVREADITLMWRSSSGNAALGGLAVCDSADSIPTDSGISNVAARSLSYSEPLTEAGWKLAAIGFVRGQLAAPGLVSDLCDPHVGAFHITSALGLLTPSDTKDSSDFSDLEPQWIVTSSTIDTATSNASRPESDSANAAANQPDRRQWTRQQRSLRATDHEPVALSPAVVMILLSVLAAVSFFLTHIQVRGPPRGPPRSQTIESERGNRKSCSSQLRRLRFSISPRGPSLVVRFAKPVTLSASGPGRTLRTSALFFISTV